MTNSTALLTLWHPALGLIVQERASRIFVRHCPLCVYPLSTWCNCMSPDLPDLPPPLFDCLQYAKIKEKTKELTTVCLNTLSTDLQFSLIGEELSRQCKHIALLYYTWSFFHVWNDSLQYTSTPYVADTFSGVDREAGYSSSESHRLIQREPGKS